MKIKKYILPTIIVVFWAVMMVFLVKDYYIIPKLLAKAKPLDKKSLKDNFKPIEEWMLIKEYGKAVGPFVMKIDLNDKHDGFIAVLRLKFKLFSLPILISADAKAELDENFDLDLFYLKFQAPMANIFTKGIINDNYLYLYILNNENLYKKIITLNGKISLYDMIKPLAAKGIDLKNGQMYKMPVFDPVWSMQNGDITMKSLGEEPIIVNGKNFNSYKIETKFKDVVRYMWVDDGGNILRQELWGNTIMERASKEEVVSLFPEMAQELAFPEIAKINNFKKSDIKILDNNTEKGILDIIKNDKN